MATVAAPLVQPGEKDHLYMCRRSNLRLIRVPRGTSINPMTGQREVGVIPGQSVQFRDGVLRVPKDGQVELEDGRRESAQTIADWLDSHRLHGNVEEGFWRVDPTAPPVSEEEIEQLMNASMRLDVATLREIARQERDGWNRESIIRRAEESAANIERALADQAEQEEAAAKPAPKGNAAK